MNRKDKEKEIKNKVDKLVNKLIPLSNKLDKIINEIATTQDTSNKFWNDINKRIRIIYEQARKIVSEKILSEIPQEYQKNLLATITDLKYRSIRPPKVVDFKSFKSLHSNKQSLRSILNETIESFNTGFKIGQNTLTRLANLTQQNLLNEKKINKAISDGFIEKGSGLASKKKLQNALLKKSIDGKYITVIDKNGNPEQWKLDTYAELVTRVKLMEASNQAVVDTAIQTGADLVQVSVHNTKCDICIDYEGKIFSLSGNDPDFPMLDDSPPFHPNCQHSLSIVMKEALQIDGTLEKYIDFSNDNTEIHPTRKGFIPRSERELS